MKAKNQNTPVGKPAGVWIDHRKAVIVALTPDGEVTTQIDSHVEKHPERAGDSPLKGSYESAQVPADDSRQRDFTGKLNIYYGKVIGALHNYSSVLLFGPGEAKGELHARAVRLKLGERIVAIETEDKMTDRQIAAKVRAHFDALLPRSQAHQ